LWSKRGDFENIQSIVMKQKPHEGWKSLGYHIFDVPDAKGNLIERLEIAKPYTSTKLHIIPQQRCKDIEHAKQFLKEIETRGGEGIVLREPNATYISKRTTKALKLKTFYDAECEVVAHHLGEGKLTGHFGSLTCKAKDGTVFNIGSGFSDEERQHPPKIGSTITYQYQEITQNGKPRFPVFLRIREKE
jgi:DNA ligase-1